MSLQLTLDNVTLMEAIAFRDDYPEAYALIVDWTAEDCATIGYGRMQAYLEALRSPAIARRLGLHRSPDKPFAINHNLRSPLTRLVEMEYPHLRYHKRRSKCDAGTGTTHETRIPHTKRREHHAR